MLGAFTMNYIEEAIGIALGARKTRMPLALSFTLETDGRLPSGDTLGPLAARVRGVRANASRRSHAELDASPSLDIGDPAELGAQYAQLFTQLPALCVVGGCCGTDHRHVEHIGRASATAFARA